MAFHISGKVGIPIGIVMILIGGVIMFSGIETMGESEEFEEFMSEPSTEFIQQYSSEDDSGSAGWYIMIQGDYFVDNNDNNVTDACEGLNLTITDSQGNDMNSTSGTIFCELDEKTEYKLENLDKSNVDINDEWRIVAIICDTYDSAEMNGYWETDRNENGEEGEKWVQTGENDRCRTGEEYNISSNKEMVLFDRDSQEALEEEGFIVCCIGLVCMICSIVVTILAVISGFTMAPATEMVVLPTGGGGVVAPTVPVDPSATTTTVPGTPVFGAGPVVNNGASESTESSTEDELLATNSLKEKFLAGSADKITEAKDPSKE